jgi:PAS domain S-box-containing protein
MVDNGKASRASQAGEQTQAGQLKRMGAVAIFAMATVLILAAAYGAFAHYAGDLRKSVADSLLGIAKLQKSLIDAHLRERYGDMRVLAAQGSTRALLRAEAGPAAQEFRQTVTALSEAYGYRRILLYDAARRPVYSESSTPLPQVPAAALAAALADGKPRLVDLHRSDSGEIVYGVVHPLHAGTRRQASPDGALYAELGANSQLYPILQNWPMPSRSGEAVLFRVEGSEVVMLGTLRNAPERAPLTLRFPVSAPDILASKAARTGVDQVFDGIDYRGVHSLGSFVRIDGTPWTLGAKMSIDEAEADVADLREAVGILAALLIFIAAVGSYAAWRYQQRSAAVQAGALSAQYLSAVSTSIDGFVRLHRDGRIAEVNEALVRMTGYTKDELERMHLSEIEAVQSADEMRTNLGRIVEAGSARFQTRWRRKDGSLVDLVVSTTYAEGVGGRFFYGFLRDITPFLEAECALRAEKDAVAAIQARMQFLLDASPVVVYSMSITDGRFKAIEVTRNVERLFGYTEQEALGADWWASNLHPEDAPRVFAAASELLDKGVLIREFRFRHRNGGYRWVRDESRVVRPESGEPGLVIGAWSDISQARVREDILSQLSLAVEQSPNAVVVTDLEARIEYANETFVREAGYSFEELRGQNQRVLKSGKTPQATYDLMWAELVAGRPWRGEFINRRKDGTEFIEYANITPLRSPSGAVTHYVAVKENVTERRRAEAALVESERRFRSLIEGAVSGFYVVQSERIIYVTSRMTEILGCTEDELVGHDPFEFVDAESIEAARAAAARFEAGERFVSYNVSARHKSGRLVTLGIVGTLAKWDGHTAMVAIAEDITERARNAQRIADYAKRLETSMHGTLNAIARMVDLRDPYTAGHQRRVGLISADIARALGWPEARAAEMELIGLVHDIGKIAVPAELLSKPSRLTPTELELIKGHAQASYDILKDVKFDLPVADIIVQHHERLDGSGYPNGLKGDEISIEGRVLAVADVLESMASHRPYRPALGIAAALAELERGKGAFYDPAVVDIVAHMVKEQGYALPT